VTHVWDVKRVVVTLLKKSSVEHVASSLEVRPGT